MPAMTIQMNGHKLGNTPVSFTQPGGFYPIILRADWIERRYNPTPHRTNEVMKQIPRTMFKIVYPTDTQVVDLKGLTAK